MGDNSYHLWEVMFGTFQVLAVLAGGLWAWRRLRRERTHTPHIEFDISCNFFGPEQRFYLAEFILSADNRGYVVHRFKSIKLRVRGIEAGQAFEYWPNHEPRLQFPLKLIDDQEVIYSEKYGHIFVEPGVNQKITFVTKIPQSCKYIDARAEFTYESHRSRSHSIERVHVCWLSVKWRRNVLR